MSQPRLVVIGASAGGVIALRTLIACLPPDLDAAIFVVLHVPPSSDSRLPDIFNQVRRLPAAHATDGEPVRAGRIYVAPPDRHLLIVGDQVRVVRGPRENRHRPAIDPLFRSAARSAGPRVIGVVLTGALDDGTSGLSEIKERGGIAIVQDPAEAEVPDMPRHALAAVAVDYCQPIAGIAETIASLVRTGSPADDTPPPDDPAGDALLSTEHDVESSGREGAPSAFTCPECGGTLWEIDDGELVRYRCRVGHAYSLGTMLDDQTHALEEALWIAVRSLSEHASLSRRIAANAARRGHPRLVERFAARAELLEAQARTVRDTLDALTTAPAAAADLTEEP